MATSKEFLNFFTETLNRVEGITFRAMMGEYVLYYGGKVIGGIYDNRVLVKDIPSARKFLPEARLELPYEGAKPMIYLEDFEDAGLVEKLFTAMYKELSDTKPRKKK